MPNEISLALTIQDTVEISLPVIMTDSVSDGMRSIVEHPDGSRTEYFFVLFENKKRVGGLLDFDQYGNQTKVTGRVFSRDGNDKLVRDEYRVEFPNDGTVIHETYVDNVLTDTETLAFGMSTMQFFIRAFPEAKPFPVGTEISMPWEISDGGNVYDNPMILVHYGKFVKQADAATGTQTWMAIFRQKYIYPPVVMDAPEQVEASEATAQEGLYYYGKVAASKYQLLDLETGDTIPYSDYMAVYKNEIEDTRANGTYSSNIVSEGYSRWSHSALRQWMNSDGDVGEWWTAQHIGDCAPSDHSTKRGFLAGFSAEDLSALQTIKIATKNETGETDYTFDKFWQVSVKEMYGGQNIDPTEVSSWEEYWHDLIGIETPGNSRNDLRGMKRQAWSGAGAIGLRTQRYSYNVYSYNPETYGSGMNISYKGTISTSGHRASQSCGVVACCAVG
jgi:hypothetical protein